MTARRILAIVLVVLGLGVVTVSEWVVREPQATPSLRDGRPVHERGGRTGSELFVDAVGLILVVAGVVVLLSEGRS